MADTSRKPLGATPQAAVPPPGAGRPGAERRDSQNRQDAVATAVFVCDVAGTILDVNAQACALLGLERDAIRGTSALSADLWGSAAVTADGVPLDPASWLKEAAAASHEKHLERLLSLRRAGDTAPRWLQVTVERLHTAPPSAATLLITLSDVTVLEETRDALARTSAELGAVLAAVPDVYIYLDAEDRVTRVAGPWRLGSSVARLLSDDVQGKAPWDLIADEAAPHIRQAVALTRATGKPVTIEFAYHTPTGRRYEEARQFPRADGGVLVIVRDVTESRHAVEALRRSEDKYRTLYAHTPVMLHSIDAEGRLVSVSDRWLERFGYDAAEVIGHKSTEFLSEESRRYANEVVLPEFFRTGECVDVAYQMVAKDGALVDVLLSATAERGDSGRVVRSLAVLLDAGAQRAAQHGADEQLSASRRELELHARVAMVFLTQPPLEACTAVLELVRETLASRWGFFGYLDVDGDLVTRTLTRDRSDACRVESEDLRIPKETWSDGLWARVLTEGTTQLLDGDGDAPAGRLPIERAVAVPLTCQGDTIGILAVADPDAEYETDDVSLLEHVAASAAPVLNEWLQHTSAQDALLAAESTLRESESLHRALFQQVPAGVVLYDADLIILDCNDSLAEIVGSPREQIIGLDLASISDSRPLAALRRPLDGDLGIYEGPYSSATGGRDLWIALKTAPRLGADGEPAGAIAVVTDRTLQRRAEDEMERLRLHDPVTGLPNRSLLADRVAQTLAHAQRKRLGFAVAAVAIDRFSGLVGTLGHEACDRLLADAAQRLAGTVRAEDTVACLAGGEFGLLLAGVGGPTQASASVEKIVEAFARPFRVDSHELFLNLSLGVAVYPADGADPENLIGNAEVAARRAPSQGGNGWQFFHASMNDERAGRLALEGELHRALERQQFLLHYQPIVQADSGKIIGLEALLRWQRPDNGLAQPLDFIAVAEEIGLMVPIGAWVLRTACAQARAWSREAGRPLRISVNLSTRQLYEASLAATVCAALKESGLPAHQLELEITETAAMSDPHQAGRILEDLRKKHVRITLDDFGTGYSSLSHLVRLPVATVKVDRSFVRDLLSVPEHAAVAASVIALGHRLGLTVIAEGVETQEERVFLRDEGCDALQGYLFSRPLAPETCAALLKAGPIAR
jgi:diguanylate cyclase (GGDEF)-like protein/PAS domain S-box-containing protein